MANDTIQVLLVAEHRDEYFVTRELLSRRFSDADFRVQWAETFDQGMEMLIGGSHAVVLVDQHLGDRDQMTFAREAFKSGVSVPLILLRNEPTIDEVRTAIGFGVADLLNKDFLVWSDVGAMWLGHAIMTAIARFEHQQVMLDETIVQESKATRQGGVGTWSWDLKQNVIWFSTTWKAIFGLKETVELKGPKEWYHRVHPDDRDELMTMLKEHIAGNSEQLHNEHRIRHQDGTLRWVVVRGKAEYDTEGSANCISGTLTDITDFKESVGMLERAGDVA